MAKLPRPSAAQRLFISFVFVTSGSKLQRAPGTLKPKQQNPANPLGGSQHVQSKTLFEGEHLLPEVDKASFSFPETKAIVYLVCGVVVMCEPSSCLENSTRGSSSSAIMGFGLNNWKLVPLPRIQPLGSRSIDMRVQVSRNVPFKI